MNEKTRAHAVYYANHILREQAKIAGAGINIAQRVMDCGDAGHILLSKHVAFGAIMVRSRSLPQGSA